MFLKQFVDEGVPWAHIDVAGVATKEASAPHGPECATGFGVRLLIEYLSGLEG
jgi:leucyl aminopeptidase